MKNIFLILLVLLSFTKTAIAEEQKLPGQECLFSQAGNSCVKGSFCQKDDGKCESTSGHCVKLPDFCMEIYMPVCGCDGKTYSNACKAKQKRVSVLKEGEC